MIAVSIRDRLGFEKLPPKVITARQRALRDAGAFHVREMIRRFRSSGDPIATRTGALRRSFGFEQRADEVRMFAAGLPYINVQEFGGVIRAKTKRYLTIPLPDAKTSSGALKGGARLVKQGNRYVTADGAPTFIFRSKRGNILIGARAKNAKTKLLYVLKESVTLKPRLGFNETFDGKTVPFFLQRFDESIGKALQ